MAEDQSSSDVRLTGRVAGFFDRQGYGFITPDDDGGSDLFVHHSSIKSDSGFRTLSVGDAVEFTVSVSGEKSQALDVTSPGGVPYRPSRRLASSRQRNGSGCYNCGNPNHIARDCTAAGSNNSNGSGCFKCGGMDHFARECPQGSNNGGSSGGACFNCGGHGHIARDCNRRGAGGVNGGGQCYNCGGYGHLARDCTSARSGGRFGGSGGGCFNCGKPGHIARECPANA